MKVRIMKTRKKVIVFPIILCVVLVLGISVQMTMAYMTDRSESQNNVFTVGTIDIQLREDHWEESRADAIHPLQTVLKDPVVVNVGSHPAYVFLEVTVPVREIHVVDENGRKTEASPCELFSFSPDSTGWSLIRTENQSDGKCYVYAYQRILNPKEETVPLFQTVTSVNYVEGELDPSASYAIDIQAKAIQSQIDAEHMTLSQVYDLLGQELQSVSVG